MQALLTVLLRLATSTTEVLKLALYCHVFLVGVALGVSAQEDEWTAIVVLCAEYGRWPTVIMHTVSSLEPSRPSFFSLAFFRKRKKAGTAGFEAKSLSNQLLSMFTAL